MLRACHDDTRPIVRIPTDDSAEACLDEVVGLDFAFPAFGDEALSGVRIDSL